MLHLASKSTSPPGAFRFRITALGEKSPSLAWVGPHYAFSDLYKDVVKRAQANGVDVPSQAEVEHQICQGLPPGHCLTEDGIPTSSPAMGMSIASFAQGTKTIFGWWVKNRRKVSKEEAMRRAYICNVCPWHKPLEGCTGCSMKPVRALIDQMIGGEEYPTDKLLQVCGVCSCGLKLKTRMYKEDILPHMPEEQKAQLWENCWLREG
jgi:hypothetical protein